MRLLNVNTLRIELVAGDSTPEYAILSHRWGDEEVSFKDFHNNLARTRHGFAKILGCCDAARREGIFYVWIDTCCIDQKSSAELSEAINSMFRWYQEAKICYAYLQDASGVDDFTNSEWFERGWTLQELVAPAEVQFYSYDWTLFGTKTGLSAMISQKAGISERFLRGDDLEIASVAERMSWAAKRKTTRPEDIAYCLLGIFNIQMPLIYGEGGQGAFARLQSQIVKESFDQSWLAWHKEEEQAGDTLYGVFAKSPAYFANCRDVVPCNPDYRGSSVKETNLGIELELPLYKKDDITYGLLDCRWRRDFPNVIGIPLTEQGGQYFRASLGLTLISEEAARNNKQRIILSPRAGRRAHPISQFFIEKIPGDFEVQEVFPREAQESSSPSLIHVVTAPDGRTSLAILVRLRQSGHAGTQDYLLKLWYEMRNNEQVPRYEVGILPDNTPLSSTVSDGISMNSTVAAPGYSQSIKAHFWTELKYQRPTFLVEVSTNDMPMREEEKITITKLSSLNKTGIWIGTTIGVMGTIGMVVFGAVWGSQDGILYKVLAVFIVLIATMIIWALSAFVIVLYSKRRKDEAMHRLEREAAERRKR